MVEADPKKLLAVTQPVTETKKLRYQVFEAYVTTAETITLEVGTLVATGTAVFFLSDGTPVTHTVATNQITITHAALVNEHVVGIGVGEV